MILPAQSPTRSRGFSLTELLVVIGIIVVLIGIALPTLIMTRRSAEVARVKSDMQAISMALEQYKNDFKDYPRSTTTRVLGRMLIAADDAGVDLQNGPGFRVVQGGKVWGPYLSADKFKLSSDKLSILDAYGTVIEYYPRWKSPGAASGLMKNDGTGMFDYRAVADANSRYYIQRALGDDNVDNSLSGETLKEVPPFVLISAGMDKAFSDLNTVKTKFSKCDEITNLTP